ncbi:hypothetical protein [Nocardia rhamnosiphila]|uniref:hypothetical protein n=1 Tax=Nocardia rhamnosiphila TaxID=426716 RepID=UPI0012DF3038|nr:hypothetical protein [Nocardia rhamnosiphila]
MSAPPNRAQLAAGPAERPRMAAHSETARPPAPEPRPAPRTIELPPELSLQLGRITVPARARPVLRSDEPVRREAPAEPVRGEVPAEAMGTEPLPGPMQSELPDEPVRTEEPRRREPLVEPVPAEPLVGPVAVEPLVELVPVEPLVGLVAVESPVEAVPAEPSVGLVPVEPLVGLVAVESPVEAVPAESPAGLVPAERPVGPTDAEPLVGPESPVEPVRPDLPAEPETAPALHLVDDPSPPDTLAPPDAEPEPYSPPEALTVVPGTGGNPADAVRLAKDMARRHGLRIRGFETAGLETEVVHQIAAALNDLLGKYTVELYGIEVTEQRDDTIRRERKKAAESGSAEPPPVWITLERAELVGPGAVGSGPTRRRFRRAGATGRPAYTAVVRAFAAALDEAGDYRARQEAWRILMAGSLSGGPDIGAGLLDPGRALVEGFVEAELHGKRAGEAAKELHRALLKMAQAESEESTA